MSKQAPVSNLTISCSNGVYNVTWERDGLRFDFGNLYGYTPNRSFSQLKSIMEEDHGIILPPEIAVKSQCVSVSPYKKVFYIADEAVQYKKEANGFYKDVVFGMSRKNTEIAL